LEEIEEVVENTEDKHEKVLENAERPIFIFKFKKSCFWLAKFVFSIKYLRI